MKVDGVLVMKPEFLIWSKLTRDDRSSKDLSDIDWLLGIEQMTDQELSNALDHLGVTDEEFKTLTSLISNS